MKEIKFWIMAILALGLLGWGAGSIYRPLGPLVVGALLWLDLLLRSNE